MKNKHPGIKTLPSGKYKATINIWYSRIGQFSGKSCGVYDKIEHAKEIRQIVADLIGKGNQKRSVHEDKVRDVIDEYKKKIKSLNKE